MKKLIYTLILVSVVLSVTVLAGCIRVDLSEKAGPITTQEYGFTDFNAIEIGDAFELEVIPADSYNVSITAGENIFDHIRVTKSGSTLKIDMDTWFHTWLDTWFSTPKATIAMPDLTALDLSGAAKGTARGFKSSHDFVLKLSGASHLDIDMETGDFEAELSGASEITGRLVATSSYIELSGASKSRLAGSGGNIRIDASGASRLDMGGFTVDDADIELSGASHASLEVSGRLDADLSGVSLLEYYGTPAMGKIDTSGASDIEPKFKP